MHGSEPFSFAFSVLGSQERVSGVAGDLGSVGKLLSFNSSLPCSFGSQEATFHMMVDLGGEGKPLPFTPSQSDVLSSGGVEISSMSVD